MNSDPNTVQINATLNYHLPRASDVLLAVEAIPGMADQTLLTDLLKVGGVVVPLVAPLRT